MKQLIYVAGPLSSPDPLQRMVNIDEALQAGYAILRRGHAPIIPHLSHFFDRWHELSFGSGLGSEFYMQWDFTMIRHCDGLLFLGPSPGACRELVLARELGLSIYASVDEIPAP